MKINSSIDSTTIDESDVIKLSRPSKSSKSRGRHRIRKQNRSDLDKSSEFCSEEWHPHGITEQKALDDLKDISLTDQSTKEPYDLIDKIFSTRNLPSPDEKLFTPVRRLKREQPHTIGVRSLISSNQNHRPKVPARNAQFNEFYGAEPPRLTKAIRTRIRTPANRVASPMTTLERNQQSSETDSGVMRIISASKPEDERAGSAIDKLRSRIMNNLIDEIRTRKSHLFPKRVNGVPELKRSIKSISPAMNCGRSVNQALSYPTKREFDENGSKGNLEHELYLSPQHKSFFVIKERSAGIPKLGTTRLHNSFAQKSRNEPSRLKSPAQGYVAKIIRGYN